MSSQETEYKKGLKEKIWDYAVWGTIGVIAIFAVIDILGPKIAALEKSLGFGALR